MARKSRGGDSGESWLNTYADMVTLLLTFFIVMLSMSTVEVEKFDALVRSLNPGNDKGVADAGESNFVVEDPQDGMSMDTLYQLISEHIEQNEMQSSISIEKQGDVVFIRFSSHMLFEPDEYVMLQESRPLMEFVASALKLYEENIRTINICGHTARTGREYSTVSDWRLSGERAATVAMFFEDYARFDKTKMITFGYGDNYPIADNATEPGRRQNRRVEPVVVGNESMENFDVYGVLHGAYDENGTGGDILTPVLPEDIV
jgi:chemotaxis protein MotB